MKLQLQRSFITDHIGALSFESSTAEFLGSVFGVNFQVVGANSTSPGFESSLGASISGILGVDPRRGSAAADCKTKYGT